jgi:RNA polymerase sigma factor (sigma-70 family)
MTTSQEGEDLRALVLRVQEGKVRRQERDPAYAEIVRRFQDMAFGLAYAVVGDYQHAEDIAQEAFMEAWNRIEGLRDPEAFPGWFRQVVMTQCHRYIRRKRRVLVSLDEATDVADTGRTAHEAAETRESERLMRSALRSLPEDDRILLVLFHLEEYSYWQVALFLELPISTVDNRLRAARRRLKERVSAMVQNDLYCVMRNRPDMVEWALDHGADIEARDWELESRPLAWAAHVGARECVEVLLRRGASVHHLEDQPWNTPIARAEKRGHAQIAELLQPHGATGQ